MDVHGESSTVGPYLWCAIGAILGWLASRMVVQKGFAPMVEAIGVGVFGAFAGGEFLPAMVLVAQPGASAISPASVAMSVAGGVVCLLLLATMRRAVGPMKPHAKKRGSN